jgi:hypothetical protein
MVLGWSNGENIVIKGILDRIAKLESKVKLLESENETQKEEISRLRNNLNNSNSSNNSNVGTEWRDIVIGKNKKLTENQMNILSVVGAEQKERQFREENLVLFGVPESKATSEEERQKDDEATVFAILDEIGAFKDVKIKRFKRNPNKAAALQPRPIRVMVGCRETALITLKKAKALKGSSHFKSVFFNRDLTTVQIVQLKGLIKTRNEENAKLDTNNKETNTKTTFRYGIRNDRVVKVYLDGN